MSLRRDCDQLVVRNAAPQKKRQPRGKLEIRDAVGTARRDVGGFLLGAHQELRARQQTTKRELDAVFERPSMTAFVVEREQSLDIRGSGRTSIRAAGQRRQNRLGTSVFAGRGGRVARQHLSEASRLFRTLRSERTLNPQKADGRVVLQLRNGVVLERLPIVLLDQVEARAVVRCD